MSRLACACVGSFVLLGLACDERTLGPPAETGGGAKAPGGGRPGVLPVVDDGAQPDAGASDAGAADADAGAVDAGGDRAICPAGAFASPPAGAPAPPPPPSFVRQPATQVPFACDPLPAAFFFPPPDTTVPGRYSRYASYEVGDATSVSIRPDGKIAALATRDGIVRLVELATSQVVGVLARPRASLNLVAFSPRGDYLLTLARGEREATLWQLPSLTRVWTVTLPGHTYDNASLADVGFTPGGIAFSPDGVFAFVSPGRGLYRLFAGTGAVQMQIPDLVVSDLAYGWGGKRLVVTVPSLVAHCQHRPHGGRVVTFDPLSLDPLNAIADWGYYPMVSGEPAFRAAPVDDLVLVPGTTAAPAVRAFRLSDGAALAPPPLPALPLAFVRGGPNVALIADGELRIVDSGTGEVRARTPAPPDGAPTAVSVSALGTLALGGRAGWPLRAWTPFTDEQRAVCSTIDARASFSEATLAGPPSSLSASGTLLALGWNGLARVLDAADGRLVGDFMTGAADVGAVQLSPDGRYLLASPASFPMRAPMVLRLPDGVVVRELEPPTTYWGAAVFSPDDRALSVTSFSGTTGTTLTTFDLVTGAPPRARPTTQYGALLGFSGGCLVVQDQVLGIFRSCAGCDDAPFAPRSYWGRLSPDGRLVATLDDRDGGAGVSVYRMPPELAVAGHVPPRANEPPDTIELPLAVTDDGRRLVLAAMPSYTSCYQGPDFEVHVVDPTTGELIDALPAGFPAVDAKAQTLAYGAQIWRAR